MANKEQVAMQNQVNTQTSVKRSAFGPNCSFSQNCSLALGSISNQGPIRKIAKGHTRPIPCEIQYVRKGKELQSEVDSVFQL